MKKLLIFTLLCPFLCDSVHGNQKVEQAGQVSVDAQKKAETKIKEDLNRVRTVDEIVNKIDNQVLQAEDKLFNHVLRVKGKFHGVSRPKNGPNYEVALNCMKTSFFDIMNLGILCAFDVKTKQRDILKKLDVDDVIVVKGKLVDEDNMIDCVLEQVNGEEVSPDGQEQTSLFGNFSKYYKKSK